MQSSSLTTLDESRHGNTSSAIASHSTSRTVADEPPAPPPPPIVLETCSPPVALTKAGASFADLAIQRVSAVACLKNWEAALINEPIEESF